MNYSAIPLEQGQSKDHILKIRKLSVKTPLPWLFDLAIDWVIIASIIFLASRANSILAYVLAIIVVGNRQHALAVLAHEGTHFTVHPNKKLNDFLSDFFCFWPLLLTVDGYRRLHFTHHGNTGTSNDPELHHKKSRAPQWDLPLNGWKLALYALKDCVGYSIPDLWIILTFSRPKTNAQLIPVALMHLTFIVLAVASGYWWIPLVWYASLGTTFMLFFRLRLWIEHQGTFETQRIKLNRVEAAIIAPHKIWLHWEHHKFPAVPHHQLENARQALNGPEPISLSQLIKNLSTASFLPSGAMSDDFQGKRASAD